MACFRQAPLQKRLALIAKFLSWFLKPTVGSETSGEMILWTLNLRKIRVHWVWYPRQWDLEESDTSWNQSSVGLNLKRSDSTESENLPKLVLYTNRGRVSGGPDLIYRAYRIRQLGIWSRKFWYQRRLIQPGLRHRRIRSREVSDHCRIRISSWI